MKLNDIGIHVSIRRLTELRADAVSAISWAMSAFPATVHQGGGR